MNVISSVRSAAATYAPAVVDVRLCGMGTALPPHPLTQTEALEKARSFLAPKFPAFDKLIPSFENAGVDCRYLVRPPDWYGTARNWPERSEAFEDGATELFIIAARRAMDAAGIDGPSVDIVVTVSSTGIATPTLEARAAPTLGFRRDVKRVPVFGLGCAGGVTGLSTARALSAAHPGANVLFVAVEACSLSFQMDQLRKADIIATILFGDGAAAAVLRTGGGPGPILGQGVEYMWPDTLDIMGWDVGENGLGVIFDRSIPSFAEAEFRNAADHALSACGLDLHEIDRFVCHPGGAKVVTAIEEALELPRDSLTHERDVLRAAGNMSAPTALFVLDRALRHGTAGQLMLCALGPGFTASFLPIVA